MLTAALFIMAETCKQSKCPLVGEWIKKTVVYRDNGILFSDKKMRYQALKRHGGNKLILLSE